MQFDESGDFIVTDTVSVHVLFYDEKPGKQAIATTSDDLMSDENHQTEVEQLTEFGKKLRSTRLDELPEILFNILIFRNKAWIVPRPLLVQYLDRYSEEQHHRHDEKSGLIGYA